MKITQLRYLALGVPDPARSHAFFTEAWGLQDVETVDGVHYLRTAKAEPFHPIQSVERADPELRIARIEPRQRALRLDARQLHAQAEMNA